MVGRALDAVNARLGRRFLVWAGILAIASVVLQSVPLFDVLGYDFAFAMGLVTAWAAVDVGCGAVQVGYRRGPDRTGASLPHTLVAAWLGALGLLVIPLLVSLVNGVRVRNCSLTSGLGFYALLPVATAVFAAPAGALAALTFPRRGRIVAWLLPLVSLVWALVRLYRDPAVYAFDPFGGYFPGPIYDEAMRPTARLAAYRAANLLWIATALAVFWATEARGSRLRKAVAVLLVGASTAVFASRGPLGFHLRQADLARALPREDRSSHFVVHGDPQDGATAEDRALLLEDLEFRHAQLVRILGASPARPVTVWNFPSSEAKKRLVGAATTLYAKPWTAEIFVQADRFPAPRLRHELAHVFAAAFGDPLFGVSARYWPWPRIASGLIEGLAEAADYGDPDGRATVHQDAKAVVQDGRAPPLSSVVGAAFSVASGARAYTVAGSFTHFLLSTHGPDKLRALYRSAGDFTGVYGRPLNELEASWKDFLRTQPDVPDERAAAKERYRRPAIFQRVCARELAARVAEAHAVGSSDPGRAVALLESVCRDDPAEPSFRIELAELRAHAGRTAEATTEASAAASDDSLTRPLRARAAALSAALAFQAGRLTDAAQAVDQTLTLVTDEGARRTALARQRALADPRARATLGRVLFGLGPRAPDAALTVFLVGRFAAAFPDEALGPYLIGRQLASRDPALALEQLAAACPAEGPGLPVPLVAPFDKECLRLTGELALRTGQLDRSERAYRTLGEHAQTQAERLRVDDVLARIAWKRDRR